MKVRFRDWIVYVVARVAIGFAARIPQAIGYALADWLGRLWFRFDRRRRGYALRFLRNAFPGRPEHELLAIGGRATGSLFMVPLDMARLTRLLARGGDLHEVVDTSESDRQLDQMTAPYLGLTAHLGSWEIAAVCMAKRAGTAHGIIRLMKNPLLNRWIVANRTRGGLIIHPRRGGFRDMANAVAQGSVGLMVVDQNQRLRGVFAPFFGELASCERAAVSLAMRRGYPILVGGAVRLGRRFRFAMVAEPWFVPENTGDKQRDLLAAVGRVNRALEAMILRAPEQYLWIHDRYRTQPKPGQAVVAMDDGEDDGGDEHDGDA